MRRSRERLFSVHLFVNILCGQINSTWQLCFTKINKKEKEKKINKYYYINLSNGEIEYMRKEYTQGK